MNIPPPVNTGLRDLPTYQPGRPIEDVARELGLPAKDIIKVASNENPLGPSPAALAAMQRVLTNINLYPDGNVPPAKTARRETQRRPEQSDPRQRLE